MIIENISAYEKSEYIIPDIIEIVSRLLIILFPV